MARMVQALKTELSELESALNLQFDLKASLHDKLRASKRARIRLKEFRRQLDLIAQCLIDADQ